MNVFDIARIFGVYLSAILDGYPNNVILQVYSWTGITCWLKYLFYLSLFKKTRYLTQMIKEVLIDLVPFMFVMAIIVVGFAHIFAIQRRLRGLENSFT
jgi:hypothetical protein